MRLRLLILLLLLAAHPALAQWQWLYPKPQGHRLRDVAFLDDNTAFAIGDVGTVMVTHDAGLTWSAMSKVNGTTSALRRVAAIDAQTAIAGATAASC